MPGSLVPVMVVRGLLTNATIVKIPPRVMFLTQIYGTILGGFINYAVMISIVNANRDLLADSNGSAAWSGATIQSYNTNATSWALAKYLYGSGGMYYIVPIGLIIGAGIVAVHRIMSHVRQSHRFPFPHSYQLPMLTLKLVVFL